MTARIIDGKAVAGGVEAELRSRVEALAARGIQPGLATIRIGSDPASELYVSTKGKKAEELGIRSIRRHFDESITEEDLLAEIVRLNEDDAVDGILVQLPLPSHIRPLRVIETINPAKDVDGFHPTNVGRLHLGQQTLVPCTPAGIMRLLESTGEKIAGREAVVIGRSDIVGKPVSALLLQRHATVTICHSRTAALAEVTRRASIVVAAIGRPYFVTADMVANDAIVIDVGINRVEHNEGAEKLLANDAKKLESLKKRGSVVVGDVDYAGVAEKASWITPVPGGVGPMTIVMLMSNTLDAAERRRS